MKSRERVIRTLEMDRPDRAPRDLWALDGVNMFQKEEKAALLERFPVDFSGPPFRYGTSTRAKGERARVGEYTDAWGCTFTVGQDGVIGEVKNPVMADWSALEDWQPPWELLEGAELGEVDAFYDETEKFVKVGPGVNPFERIQYLRGSENVYMDLALESPELMELLRRVHEWNLRAIEIWLPRKVDALSFMDDWGSQQRLLINPEMWRRVFKPLYQEYCDLIHGAGKYVFMHSDGNIESIYPDLIEIGVNAQNSQLFIMDIEGELAQYKGEITFWGELDRQWVLPFGTPDDVRAAVRRVRNALDDGEGGVIAQFEWQIGMPPENAHAAFETWL